jgi:uncharacterized protein (DUF697 family)
MSVVEKAAAIPTESDQVQLVRDDETASAERIIQDHVLLAGASGLIPGPGIDLVAAFTVQMTMLKRIANLYDVPFRQDAAKSTMTALMGTLGGAGAAMIAGSFFKFVPVLGTVIGMAGTSIGFGAFTYGIGKVFQRHFETGGTFVDLDPSAYRDYFRDMNTRGRKVAAEEQSEARDQRSRPTRRTDTAAAEA